MRAWRQPGQWAGPGGSAQWMYTSPRRRLGGPVLLAELGDLLYHVEGVENYRLLAPAADLAAEDGTLPMLGRVTVTEMEADDDV